MQSPGIVEQYVNSRDLGRRDTVNPQRVDHVEDAPSMLIIRADEHLEHLRLWYQVHHARFVEQ